MTRLRSALAFEPYRGSSPDFAALGDETGLVLIMRRRRILKFNPASQEKAARVYATAVHLRGTAADKFGIDNFPYEIRRAR